MAKKKAAPVMVCTPVALPAALEIKAAQTAMSINPANSPNVEMYGTLEPSMLTALTSKYWGAGGVDLSVGFMESVQADLREKILAHLNAWATYGNVRFRWSQTTPEVRISRGPGGYWSYLGTDILSIPFNQPTMNLEGFTMKTPDAEFTRVIRHEAGHTLGFPHEHQRAEIIAMLDEVKTVAFFRRTQGWTEEQTRQQVLTPISERAVIGTERADPRSIMTYQFPAAITKDGKPIPGGLDIGDADREFVAKLYPKPAGPVPPATRTVTVQLEVDAAGKTAHVVSVS